MSSGLDDDLDTIEDAITHWHRTVTRHGRWEALVSRAGVPNVDRSGALILHMLANHEADKHCRLGMLASKLGVEAPSATRQIQQLEAAGLVVRKPDPNDGRATDIRITAAGRKVARRIKKAKREYMRELLSSWPAKDRHQLATLFHRLATQAAPEQSKK